MTLTTLLAAWVSSTPQVAAVPLHFNWQPGAAKVFYDRKRLRGDQLQDSGDVRYTIDVSREAGGLVLRPQKPVVGALSSASVRRVIEAVPLPVLSIAPDGSFKKVLNSGQVMKGMSKVATEGSGAMPPQLQAIMKDAMESTAKDEWNQLVGFWVGKSLEPGVSTTSQFEGPLPLGVQKVKLDVTYALTDWVPCTAKQPEKKCVKLTLMTRPAPSELPRVLEAFTAQMVAAAGQALPPNVKFDAVTSEQNTELITDPATLRPYRISTARHVVIRANVDGELQEQKQTDESVSEYEY